MKRFLVALALATPFAARAVPDPDAPKTQVTGTVQVAYPRCFGCPPIVSVKNGVAYTRIKGDLALDLAAFDGKTVTVEGSGDDRSFEATGFAPGKSGRFVTGTVEVVELRCPPGRRCIALARPPKVYLSTAGGEKILIPMPGSVDLLPLEGAKVTVRGDVVRTRCAPGVRCLGSEPTLRPDVGKNLLVRARVEKLPHGMNGQTHTATLDNGNTLLVSGPQWADRNHATIWMSGRIDRERISGAPMFRATSGSRAVPVVPAIDPFPRPVPVDGADGANVARDAGTRGGAPADGATGGAQGAGIARD